MMKTRKLGLLFWTLLFLSPTALRAEVFQWTDNRGVIHFTDNLHSVPEPLRNSSHLTIREDFRTRGISSEAVLETKAPEVVSPPEPEPAKLPPVTIHYNPQHITIVVVNTIVSRPKRICNLPGGCRGVFRPNFNDRRYIHPSVFDGGSRQFIQPESFQPTRR